MTGPAATPATTPATNGTQATGNIYDLGYRGYEGPRLGRPTVLVGLLRQSLRESYGLGRGTRAKIAPFVLLGFSVFPAVLAVGFRALAAQVGAGAEFDEQLPIRHDTYQSVTSLFVWLFVAAQAPELFGRDQRYGSLPLYFSRVLTRVDYALARTGGLFVAVLIVTLVPQLLLSIGGILAAPDPAAGLGEELPEIPRYLLVCLLEAGVFSGIGAVVAAHTPRRAYAVAAIIALFIVPPIVVELIEQLSVPDVARVLLLASPSDVIDGVNGAIYGPLTIAGQTFVLATLPGWVYIVTAVGFVAGSLAIVVRRYLTITV